MGSNSREALEGRRATGMLTWRGPVVVLFARGALGLAAHGLVASLFAMGGSSTPWRDAEPWLPVYGTLIDVGCLALVAAVIRREGITLADLIGCERARLGRDLLAGLALVPASLVFIVGGVYVAGWIVFGTGKAPYLMGGLPRPATLYALVVFPVLWGITEQVTYNGYLSARFEVLFRNTAAAIVVVAFAWALQHAFMPMTFDPAFMAFRLIGSIPYAVFAAWLYLRFRRLLPLAVAHALLDGGAVLIPLLRGP